jgi:predicted nucleic-acid-binding protein
MTHLDTNVVVRLIVGDDISQTKLAEYLITSEACLVSPSVLMETEWVLRAAYGLNTQTIHASLSDFLALENIASSDPVLTSQVLDAYSRGLDFADALHALQTTEGQWFASFDKKLARAAGQLKLKHIRLLR